MFQTREFEGTGFEGKKILKNEFQRNFIRSIDYDLVNERQLELYGREWPLGRISLDQKMIWTLD
jgi:hypothetical protein